MSDKAAREEAERLDAMPDGTVLMDREGDIWQYRGGLWCSHETAPCGSLRLIRYGPFVHLAPARPAVVTETQVEAAARVGWPTLFENRFAVDAQDDTRRKVRDILAALNITVEAETRG